MTQFDPSTLSGATVRSASGDKIGTVEQVYVDDHTSQPEWVTVRTGLFGTKESFVPLAAARFDGADLVIDASKKEVSDAPKIDDDGHLSEQDEDEIYRYYGGPVRNARFVIIAGFLLRGTVLGLVDSDLWLIVVSGVL